MAEQTKAGPWSQEKEKIQKGKHTWTQSQSAEWTKSQISQLV